MKTSSLLKHVVKLQGDEPWGHVLDAGTGPKSLSWIASLPTERWTAITAQASMAESSRHALKSAPRAGDRLIVGNWVDEDMLPGERFDTVVLDYFIGAVDAFAPYFQEELLHRMVARTRGSLYLIGLEPYVPVIAEEEVGAFVGDLGRLRDACQLLARDRPYREYPAPWVAAQLQRLGMQVTDTRFFRIRYRQPFLEGQLAICESRARACADPALTAALLEHIDRVRRQGEALIERHDGLPCGRDYVIRAVPAK